MKKTLTFLSFIFLYNIAFSQCFYDSIVSFNNFFGRNEKYITLNFINNNELKTSKSIFISENDTISQSRSNFEYDKPNNKTTTVYEVFTNNNWEPINKTEKYTNIEINYQYNSDSSQFFVTGRDVYTVNFSNYKELIFQNFNRPNNKWINSHRRLYFYFNDNNTQITYQTWDERAGLYVNSGCIKYVYENNILVSDTSYTVNPSNFNFEKSGYNNYIKNKNLKDSVILNYNTFGNLEFENHITYYNDDCVYQVKNYSYSDNNKNLTGVTTYYKRQNATFLPSFQKSQINIYPNPTSNKLTINGLLNMDCYLVDIISGKIIWQEKIKSDSQEIDILSITNGIYIFKSKNINQKIIIQH